MLALFRGVSLAIEEEISSESDEDETTPRQCMSHEAMIQLNEMRVKNELCDASIEMSNGDVFNVHRPIMCACSEYFRCVMTFFFGSHHHQLHQIIFQNTFHDKS